jgi:hypothetical protein
MDLYGPEPDLGALARSMGMWGEGPIENPKDVRGALLRAIEVVKREARAGRYGDAAPVRTSIPKKWRLIVSRLSTRYVKTNVQTRRL